MALDDLPLEAMDRPGGCMAGHCIQIDPAVGMTDADVHAAMQMLGT